MTQDRKRAYEAARWVTKGRMAEQAPLDAAALEAVTAADIVVVDGCYDHVEQVLDAMQTPFTRVPASALSQTRLRPEQLLVVNCPARWVRARW